MIKAVFIDIDGTLLDFEACVEESMRVGLTENKIEYKPEMLETFHRINDVFWRDLEQGKITFEELLERRWATVFEALGIDLNGPEFETYFRKRLHESAIPMEGSYETLEYLSGKYRLFAASNGPHEQQIERLRKADMLRYFEENGTARHTGGKWYWMAESYPASALNMRSISNDNFIIIFLNIRERLGQPLRALRRCQFFKFFHRQTPFE